MDDWAPWVISGGIIWSVFIFVCGARMGAAWLRMGYLAEIRRVEDGYMPRDAEKAGDKNAG